MYGIHNGLCYISNLKKEKQSLNRINPQEGEEGEGGAVLQEMFGGGGGVHLGSPNPNPNPKSF